MGLDPDISTWYASDMDRLRKMDFRGAQISKLNETELRALTSWLLIQLTESQKLLGEAVRGD
jgi:hypothetical protein